mgnify:CR=1 FL=1
MLHNIAKSAERMVIGEGFMHLEDRILFIHYHCSFNQNAVEGRLYLNASTRVQRRWARDAAEHIERADANWPGLRE